MAVYTLSLQQVLGLLREFQSSGILRANLSHGILREKGECVALLQLSSGIVISCMIQKMDGQMVLSSAEALNALMHIGQQDWTFNLQAQTSTAPVKVNTALSVPANTPKRVDVVVQRVFSHLERKQRRVLLMIDGQRNIDEIATLLWQTYEETEALIRQLRSIGAVE